MNDKPEQERPTCAVHGMIQPGAMCSKIIVGMKYCGYSGECPHKQEAAAKAEGAENDH